MIVEAGKELVVAKCQMELPPLRRGWHIDIDKLAATNFHPLLIMLHHHWWSTCLLWRQKKRWYLLPQDQPGSPSSAFPISVGAPQSCRHIWHCLQGHRCDHKIFIMTHVLWLKFFDHLVTVPSTLPLSSTPPWQKKIKANLSGTLKMSAYNHHLSGTSKSSSAKSWSCTTDHVDHLPA